jgi:hypothetical protein
MKHAAVTDYGIKHDEEFHLLDNPALVYMFWYFNTVLIYHNRNIIINLKAQSDNSKGLSLEMDLAFDDQF